MRKVAVLTNVEQRLLIHLKHFRFPKTLRSFYANAKTPLPERKLYGATKDTFMRATLKKIFRKTAEHFHVLCVLHVMVAVLMVVLVSDIIQRTT